MRVHWLWLSRLTKVSPLQKQKLLQLFGDPEQLYNADVRQLRDLGFLSADALEQLGEKDLTQTLRLADHCQRCGIDYITIQDTSYPPRLRALEDSPLVLYYKGRLPDFTAAPCIALVGARKASAFGMLTAKRLGYQLGKAGAIVVSGLAEGIDGMGMVGALSADAPVVGVLGCGADVIYPLLTVAEYTETSDTSDK